ncbi:10152_t:CDS:2 [Acaulospora colombiana]|uniref:10152_t:CDS:1 n=1 Tax=Acaulospora colombiana TaxID=27376 RepID=A0ACA9N011_9GLOM|nr:10152_t:CDS:2 [Acaulospora colombiana]
MAVPPFAEAYKNLISPLESSWNQTTFPNMRIVSLHILAIVFAVAVSAIPSPTIQISTSSDDGGGTVETMPSVIPVTGSLNIPTEISEAPGPVVSNPTSDASGSTLNSSTTSLNGTTTTTRSDLSTLPATSSSTGAASQVTAFSGSLSMLLLLVSAACLHL